MRWHRLILPAVGLLAGALALPRGTRDSIQTNFEPLARRLEVARLRAHFDSVDAELRQAGVLELSGDRQTGRTTLIGWLREYREAGRFPRNDRLPQRTPFFRDDRGTLCAMAYLIERSGRPDLVDRIALTGNNAYIAELADDPNLRLWLDSVGLSVAEAARIQPSYGGDVVEEEGVSTEYALTSMVVSGTSLATLALNLWAPSRSTGQAGVFAGGLAVLAGAVNLDGSDDTKTVAAANILIGAAAVAAGVYRLVSPPPGRPEEEQPQQSTTSARLALEPQVIPTTSGTRLGLAMHARF